jgi:predicted lipoprotein with Yx(FWY)xxD motif
VHGRLPRDLAAGPRHSTVGLPKHVAAIRRPDGGKLQLTYDGHPLYRYAGDRSKADANGEGVGGQWYRVAD